MYREFNDRFTKLEQLNILLAASATKTKQIHVPTAASAPKPKQRRKLKRATVSPTSGGRGKKPRSEQSLPPPISTLSESENSLMEESDFSDDSSEKHVTQKDVTPAAIPGLPGSADIGDAPSKLDEGSRQKDPRFDPKSPVDFPRYAWRRDRASSLSSVAAGGTIGNFYKHTG
ncbi:hypothetical protein TNCT_128191 [Trichonephila clavata]|uniref:Uncharacterized protein n=1 Tax=Trichonephila clavata TaxID=2740835 RepID=A0A8X6LU52_TRICU|nr:hypothetical protein TNCT_128191 [Trichonephila clavata]